MTSDVRLADFQSDRATLEAATVYRMNAWDVDGLTPASRSLLPTKK